MCSLDWLPSILTLAPQGRSVVNGGGARFQNRTGLVGVVRRVTTVMLLLAASGASGRSVAADAFEQNRRLGRGVNVPVWNADFRSARGLPDIQAEDLEAIRRAGFSHVRLNLHPFRGVENGASREVDRAWLNELDRVVEHALARGLMVVLDFHESNEMASDPARRKEQFLAFWAQIAERYRRQPPELLFEILNEPHGRLTSKLWNQFLRAALDTIRRTNPDRTVAIGPAPWNDLGHLRELELPEDDRHLIVTIHYYRPMEFTHQGAAWTRQRRGRGVPWNGTPEEREAVTRDFYRAQEWCRDHRRPLYMGEFGALEGADMPSRVRYIDYVARQAEQRGLSWAFWLSKGDLIVDADSGKRLIEPIRKALFPRRED